jgi:hypothetical protein
MTDWIRAAWVVVALHALVSIVHSVTHVQLSITPALSDALFIVVVILALPIVSVLLLRRSSRAAWLLSASLGASFIYGALSHFVLAGPDNAFALGGSGWATSFLATTIGLAILEVLGFGVGLILTARLKIPSGPAAPPA